MVFYEENETMYLTVFCTLGHWRNGKVFMEQILVSQKHLETHPKDLKS